MSVRPSDAAQRPASAGAATEAEIAALDGLMQSGRFADLLGAAGAVLGRAPNDRRVVLRRACALFAAGRGDEAAAALARAGSLAPARAGCHAKLGLAFDRLGLVASAIEQFKTALDLAPGLPAAWSGLASLHFRRGAHETALRCVDKAIAAAPRAASAHMLRGLVLGKLGRREACLAACRRAAALSARDPVMLCSNAHIALNELGEIDQARRCLETALRADPGHERAQRMLADLRLQDPVGSDDAASWRAVEARAAESGDAVRLIQAAIGWVLAARWDALQRLLATPLAARLPEEVARLTASEPKRAQFLNGYARFLQALRADPPGEGEAAAPPILHFGESHCLSYAHRTLNLGGAARRIAPRLTFGAKAHHLGAAGPNQQKAVLARQAAAAPRDAAALFFSFGEIDCRADEGVMRRHRKCGEPVGEIADRTVAGYLDRIATLFGERACPAYVFGVPAPVRPGGVGDADHRMRIEAIRRFNRALETGAAARGFGFVDLWRFTAAPDGSSNGRFHCDDVHLGPAALSEIQKQLA